MIQQEGSGERAPLETAVLFLVFNRLDTTKEVFQQIRSAKPPRLYIAADGPRASKEGESEKVAAVRAYLLQRIDWSCEVKTLFRDENLGCKYAVSGAISWFFESENQGIILEDDCVPSLSFFWYCEQMLKQYETDDSVFLISGDARGSENTGLRADYAFCKYPMIWGWATWARVWQQYDVEVSDWPDNKRKLDKWISPLRGTRRFWRKVFDSMYRGAVDTWDYQLCYLLLKMGGKCIVPRKNLVTNIGFGVDATHTLNENDQSANRPRFEVDLPLLTVSDDPSNENIDNFYDRHEFFLEPLAIRFFKKFREQLKAIF